MLQAAALDLRSSKVTNEPALYFIVRRSSEILESFLVNSKKSVSNSKMTLIGVIISQRAFLERHKSGLCMLGFLLFLGVGAQLFLWIEGPAYEQSQKDILEAKRRIVKKYENLTSEALDAFIEEMRVAGIRGLPKKNSTIAKWRFSESVFFVTTLLTTVGYGHFSPKTLLGKIVCVLYTAAGIPITLIHLAYYVDKLLKFSENYKAFLFRKYQGRWRPFCIRLTHVSSLMSCIVLSCFILPAFLFSHFEKGWDLFESVYFCFISLTTVGLGDFVPAINPDLVNPDLYVLGASAYLIVGVTIIMFMMAMCGDFHRNYMNGYEILPFTITTEKIPINPGPVVTYGSVSTKNGDVRH